MESSDGILINNVKSKQSTPTHNANPFFNFNDDLQSRREKKLKEVRNALKTVGEQSPDGLKMIDTLQRLGVDFHFQEEIEAILKTHGTVPYNQHHNLHDLALRFRLLRQEGFHVHPDVFVNFKENRDEFTLENDIKGLMALYEASQLSMEGEDIVDEAGEFSAKILRSWLPCLDQHTSKIVTNTLNYPHHKNLARLMFKNITQNFEVFNDQYLKPFLELAKIEHHMARTVHQKEILLITKWWKELGLAKELKYARNQPIKWHMWSMAVLTDPSLSEQRIELTKPISLVYIIDDVFDVYGKIDELTLFTEAVNRWDLTAAKELPLYMKMTLKSLYDTTNYISNMIFGKHGWNPFTSFQKAWTCLCNAFLVEAKWFASGKLPNSEEYLKNGIISSGVHVVLVHMFFLLGQGLNKQVVNLVDNFPGIIFSTAKILRLCDDMGTAKDENQDGLDGSYLMCYMKENPDMKIEDAKEEVCRMVSETWKQLNQECLRNGPFPATFRKACLNVARMVPLMYNYDNDSVSDLKELMNSLLFETETFHI